MDSPLLHHTYIGRFVFLCRSPNIYTSNRSLIFCKAIFIPDKHPHINVPVANTPISARNTVPTLHMISIMVSTTHSPFHISNFCVPPNMPTNREPDALHHNTSHFLIFLFCAWLPLPKNGKQRDYSLFNRIFIRCDVLYQIQFCMSTVFSRILDIFLPACG